MNDFEKWFSKSTRRFEKALLKLGIGLILLLFLSQYLMSHDSLKGMLNYMVRLEGPKVEEVFAPETTITRDLRLELELVLEGWDLGQGSVVVLVNQEERATFKEGRVHLVVREGDMIEIDSFGLKDAVTVRVISASPLLRTPLVGHSVTTHDTNELLGWVTLE